MDYNEFEVVIYENGKGIMWIPKGNERPFNRRDKVIDEYIGRAYSAKDIRILKDEVWVTYEEFVEWYKEKYVGK